MVDSSSTWFYNDATSTYPTWGGSYDTNITISPGVVGVQPGTAGTQTIRYYTPAEYLPPVAEDVAEDDLAWLGKRVAEIEDYSRIAA